MPLVKVWNDNQFDHTERFKGKELTIKAGGFIEMDYIDAVQFKGQFTPMRMRGPNDPDPRFFKKIRVEEPTEPVVKEDPNVFHATGKAAASPEEMIAFAKAYAAANPDLVVQDPVAERAKGPSNAELLEKISALEAQINKRGPGRPKKGASA